MQDVHGQRFLATAERAEVGHFPAQADQPQQALDAAASPWSLGPVAFPWLDLPQRHAERGFHRLAGLDGSVTVDGLRPRLPVGCAAQAMHGSRQIDCDPRHSSASAIPPEPMAHHWLIPRGGPRRRGNNCGAKCGRKPGDGCSPERFDGSH
jgi:hypothetical protein